MSEYFKTDSKTVEFDNTSEVSEAYNSGFVFTRLGKGIMNQTRSLRIDLSKFELSSENRRILGKNENLILTHNELPLTNYTWKIHKLGKDFYSQKFGEDTMSASKIKEMFNEMDKSNMNVALSYQLLANSYIGYCLCYENEEILHYAYPFYDLNLDLPNLGLGMMLKAILWAKEMDKKYIYLGSVVGSKAKYKLQFEGLEWWNENKWSDDIDQLKDLLTD